MEVILSLVKAVSAVQPWKQAAESVVTFGMVSPAKVSEVH